MNVLASLDQSRFAVRCEWGPRGVELISPACDAVVIVDVLSFSTCVDVAASRGAAVLPYRWMDASARYFAQSKGAELAEKRRAGTAYSLSPVSLQRVTAGTRIVLPSPNGAALSLATGATPTFTACFRNAAAVAAAAARCGPRVAVIAAGERWPQDQSLRPALEDLAGAGAVIDALPGARSPGAEAAAAVFRQMREALEDQLGACGSGRELIDQGFAQDVAIAAQLNVSTTAPRLVGDAYVAS